MRLDDTQNKIDTKWHPAEQNAQNTRSNNLLPGGQNVGVKSKARLRLTLLAWTLLMSRLLIQFVGRVQVNPPIPF